MFQLLALKRQAAITLNQFNLLVKSASSTRFNSTQPSSQEYKVGDVIHGYKLEQVDHIKELNIKPFLFRHQVTGAEHLHVQKEEDSNNVFSVLLRTTPVNSTGVAHILEHIALSGSKRYKVRDAFFQMQSRSLATFMNAMTGPDYTMYPFSTQNRKDFENILNIYTDAVFFPRLKPHSFRQEGWRLEHEKPDKKDTPILIKGVVYNEMKGALSSSSAIYSRHLLNCLFPDNTYQYESGGDPEVIPKLTHGELKRFYDLHYHPSNAKFYTYGDIPVENHLKLINELVLSKFNENSQAKEHSKVDEQEPWSEPRVKNIQCALDPLCTDPNKQTTTSISYMMPTSTTNHDDVFPLLILSRLLIDGQNTPFYKNLLESGLGSDFSPSTGFSRFTRQPYFSIGLQNIRSEDITKVHELIEKTFKEVAEQGFAKENVDAVLHKIELNLKHVSGNFGLELMMSLESVWNHDGDIFSYMRVDEHVKKFRHSLESDKDYWKKLIERNFLSNKHKLILNMFPDAEYEKKRDEKEKALLEEKISKLSATDKQTILYEGMELVRIQNAVDNVSVLPCLNPSEDISRDLKYITELEIENYKGVQTQYCVQPTNEVVYFRALIDIGSTWRKLRIAPLLDYLPLFCDVATKLGAGNYDRHKLSQKIDLTTGGLSTSIVLNPNYFRFDEFENKVLFESYCLRGNTKEMFELWSNLFREIHFEQNKEYLSQLIRQSASELVDSISFNGHMYAVKKSASNLSNLAALDESLSGLSHIARMKDIASKESVESIVLKLNAIAGIVFYPGYMKCAINCDKDSIQVSKENLEQFIDDAIQLQSNLISCDNFDQINYDKTRVEDMKLPFATHYVAKSFIAVPRDHPDFPKLAIMSNLVSLKYLIREIRERGGAYGAGAKISNSGILSFYSYRDPNTDRTLKVFNSAADWLIEGKKFTDWDIEEAKLGVFRAVDMPVEPHKRGLNYFLTGETDGAREWYRHKLLDVTKNDVMKVAEKYLTQEKFSSYLI